MAGLFKKKRKKARKKKDTKESEMTESPQEGVSETIVDENDFQNILSDALKGTGIDDLTEKIDDLSRRIDELQSKIERHDSLIGSLENEISELRKLNEESQDNIKRLLDIYEVVSQKINPFINMDEKSSEFPTKLPTDEPLIPENAMNIESGEKEKESVEEEFHLPIAQPPPTRPEKREKIGTPILTQIKKDYYTIVLLMRWIEFLFERVKRDKITLLLDYYVDIGWISREVKSEIMAYARGEVQDVTRYFPEEEIEAEIETPKGTIKPPSPKIYKKVDDWRLSAEDHLKSLLFIMKIAGIEINKDTLNSLEQEIEKFKKSLWEYHGV